MRVFYISKVAPTYNGLIRPQRLIQPEIGSKCDDANGNASKGQLISKIETIAVTFSICLNKKALALDFIIFEAFSPNIFKAHVMGPFKRRVGKRGRVY